MENLLDSLNVNREEREKYKQVEETNITAIEQLETKFKFNFPSSLRSFFSHPKLHSMLYK